MHKKTQSNIKNKKKLTFIDIRGHKIKINLKIHLRVSNVMGILKVRAKLI
jgi:hypothetical protein